MRKINHFGIPTKESQPGEMYNEGMQLFLTDYAQSPNRIEFLRFDEDSWMPEILKKHAHIAYEVDSIEDEMKGKTVVLPVTKLSNELTIAFIEEEGIGIELMEFTKK